MAGQHRRATDHPAGERYYAEFVELHAGKASAIGEPGSRR